ncbi:hypothetical protein PoB_003459600, partial [Plakobranchus ocellatus]
MRVIKKKKTCNEEKECDDENYDDNEAGNVEDDNDDKNAENVNRVRDISVKIKDILKHSNMETIHQKYANIALDETSFGLAEPETVTDLAGFQEELIKYRTELDKLYESLNASYGDLTNGEVSQTFADAVWTLQDKIGYVYGD